MFITRARLPRREVLKGLGAALALPMLDAMVPALARASGAAAAQAPTRLVCIEMVHGAAGSSACGSERHLWAPAGMGRDFDLAPTSLAPLDALRPYLTIVSNTDVPSANATTAREIGGDHFRSSAVFLTQSYPERTEGAGVHVGTSLDQIYAQRAGQDTPIPSLQLCIEDVDQAGGCQYGYSCAYVDTISWATPTRPLPMVRDPRVVFDQMVGAFGDGASEVERRERRRENRSVLDFVRSASARLRGQLGAADRARLDDYLDTVRQIERRIQNVEAHTASGEPRVFPAAPPGVPDDYGEHVRLMFDLQRLAFTSDITRVIAFKMSRDGSNRTFPESGFTGPFHNTSHHGGRSDRILDLARINTYHVGLVADFLKTLEATPDGDGHLLDRTVVLYGSPMGDPNLHNHKRVPFVLAGRANGALIGGVHLRAPDGTPLSNVMLGLLHALGLGDVTQFGDSERPLSLS